MKGLQKMVFRQKHAAWSPDREWKGGVGSLRKCACGIFTTARLKDRKTKKSSVLCQQCAQRMGYAEAVR